MPFAGRLYVHVVKGVGLDVPGPSSPPSGSSTPSDASTTPRNQANGVSKTEARSASKRLAASAYNFLRRRSLTPTERATTTAASAAKAAEQDRSSDESQSKEDEQQQPNNPYLELRLGEQVETTEPAASNGVWGSDFRFAIVNSDSEGANHGLPLLIVTCRQANTDALIGQVKIPVDRLPERDEIESWYQLYNPPPGTSIAAAGAVPGKGALYLRLRYDSVALRSTSSFVTETTKQWTYRHDADAASTTAGALGDLPLRGKSDGAMKIGRAAGGRADGVGGLRVETSQRHLNDNVAGLSKVHAEGRTPQKDTNEQFCEASVHDGVDSGLQVRDNDNGNDNDNGRSNHGRLMDIVAASGLIDSEMHATTPVATGDATPSTDSQSTGTVTISQSLATMKPPALDVGALSFDEREAGRNSTAATQGAGKHVEDKEEDEELEHGGAHIPAVPPVPARPTSSPTRASRYARGKQKLSDVYLQCRLADYFVVVGVNSPLDPSFRDDHLAMVPELRSRFPEQDHDNVALPVKLEWFCFPNGIRPIRVSSPNK
jgi:hypothetical protein